ncbi:MAG: hypothetical protein ACXVZQ_00785, partial [Terriglobales bacterium]
PGRAVAAALKEQCRGSRFPFDPSTREGFFIPAKKTGDDISAALKDQYSLSETYQVLMSSIHPADHVSLPVR